MDKLHKLKKPATHLIGGFLLALQAVMGVPFLLTIVGSVRRWDVLFYTKKPR